MREPKWTPGPWRLNKYRSIGAGEFGTNPIVAHVEPFYGEDCRHGDDSANARLIAAAPDLYDALAYIFDHITDKERRPRDLYPAFGLDSRRAIEMAAAALTKARGCEQPGTAPGICAESTTPATER